MQPKSLGYRTDLIFARFDGEVIDRGDHLMIKTASNPGFYWGNFLLFAQPPRAVDKSRWCSLFEEEIGRPPEVNHQVFGWDTTDGEPGVVQPFLDEGFRLASNVVMTSAEPFPPRRPADLIDVRPLKTESEWSAAVENQVISRELEFSEDEYRDFRQRQMARYRQMVESDLGDWYGAFVDGRLVADLGVFIDEDVGRYQSVQTHPDYRRQGIGGTLVFESGRQAIGKYGLKVLVIVAELDSRAASLYQSVGFQHAEEQMGLETW
ncbi:MAG: GNAT family N-acetyltransferase [Anaerolineales bacterium]